MVFSDASPEQLSELLYLLDHHTVGLVDVDWLLDWIEGSWSVGNLDNIIERMRQRWPEVR